MYIVVGGDGKEYGPISGEDMRRWIAEGRLNAQSLAKAESDAEFRTLATFPEFAHLFGVAAPGPGIAPMLAGADGGQEAALSKIRVPAIGLMISSIISVLLSLVALVRINSTAAQLQQIDAALSQLNNPQMQQFADSIGHFLSGPFGIANYLFQILIGVFIFIGALKMLKLRSYQICYTAAILAVVPCITPCCGWILGLIFGIWAMTALGKIKAYFS